MKDQNAGRRSPRQPLPPLTRSVQDPRLPHTAVLDELLSPVGVLLWQLLHDTTLWSTAERSARRGLFADAARATAGAVPGVEEELDALGVLVRDPHPDAGPIIARMCDRVRTWAEERGLDGTALAFAQAAALADPEDARGAYQVGRLARRRAEYARAEVWYQRAGVLANRCGDREVRAVSLSGLGSLHAHRGNYAGARKLKQQAIRLAKRHSLREVLGVAYHDLAVIDFETGEVQSGMRHAGRALRIFGAGDDRTPEIVHDMAVALMDQCGAFATARDVLQVVLPHLARPGSRLFALANLARASAAVGDVETYDAIWTDLQPVLLQSTGVGSTDALLALARGGALLRDWDRAREAASRALVMAQERGEGKSIYLADALLAAIAAEHHVDVHGFHTAGGSVGPEIASFARELRESLAGRVPNRDDILERFHSVLTDPGNPRKAYELARALRGAAEYTRATAWFEHGKRLANRAGDFVAEAMCLGGLGNLHLQRGDLESALDFHRRRLDLARREGLREQEGGALGDLCSVGFAAGNGQVAYAYAREALEALGPGHPFVPRLAQDLAMYLMDICGDFENALLLFQALQRAELPREVLLVARAGLARAAAGAGRVQLFEETWSEAWSELERPQDSEYQAGALIQLAQGALVRGHRDLAERAARLALGVATRRGEEEMAAGAESLVEAVIAARATRARTPPRRSLARRADSRPPGARRRRGSPERRGPLTSSRARSP